MPTPPVHKIRVGMMTGAVWSNQYGLSASFQKSYKPKDSNEWKTTTFFGPNDVLALAKCADLAHTWMLENKPSRSEPYQAPQQQSSEPEAQQGYADDNPF